MPVHRRTLIAASAVAALVLAGCADLFGPPTITLTQDDIERLLQRQFPLERRLLDVFEVSVARPQVRLLPDRKRLAAVIDLQVRDRLLGGLWTAQLAFDASLRWDPSDQTLRLDQVRVQDLVLGPGAPVRSVGERIAALVVEGMLEGQLLYRLPTERAAELRRRGLQPGTVQVGPRGLEITLVPLVL